MFNSQSLRAVVRPGAIVVRELRLDDVVRQLDVRGTVDAATVGELAQRIDAALAGGVRWLIVDIAGAVTVSDEALQALSATISTNTPVRPRSRTTSTANSTIGSVIEASSSMGAS